MLKVLITGPAGSGKGTNSELICEKYHIAHISTGDMFREEIKNETPLGLEATSYISKGLLVPDDVTIAMVKNRITRDDCKNGYLLDGFPRSLKQAQAIEDLNIDIVINLVVDYKMLEERIVNRRICKKCGKIYHLISKPSKVAGICDDCGGTLYQRDDDTSEKLKTRLASYDLETAPVIDYYRSQNKVVDIDSCQNIEEVFIDIEKCLDSFMEGMY